MAERLRVLMTADPIGGVYSYALELARALEPHGVELALATSGAPLSPSQRAELSTLAHVEVFEGPFRLEWMEDPWDDVARAGDWLLEVADRVRPNLIHLNDYAHGALPWRRPVLMVGHSCVLSWWRAVHGRPAPPGWDRYRLAVRRGLAAATRVVAPTQAMLDSLTFDYGPLPPCEVIPNGRDPARFHSVEKLPLVLAAGRLWDEAKNLCALEAAAPRLAWPVEVAGETSHPDGGVRSAVHVRALGRLSASQLAEALGRAAIFAAPAKYEPFGLAPLEAALSGCALVLGDLPSLREVWGQAAAYVSPSDPEALVTTLSRLIADGPERARAAGRARARAARYSPQAMGRRYLRAYRELLAKPAQIASSGEACA